MKNEEWRKKEENEMCVCTLKNALLLSQAQKTNREPYKWCPWNTHWDGWLNIHWSVANGNLSLFLCHCLITADVAAWDTLLEGKKSNAVAAKKEREKCWQKVAKSVNLSCILFTTKCTLMCAVLFLMWPHIVELLSFKLCPAYSNIAAFRSETIP